MNTTSTLLLDHVGPAEAGTVLTLVRPHPAPRASERPRELWVELGHGRWTCPTEGPAPHEAVLSPLHTGQAVRLLEVDGEFHILTGPVADDRAMQVVAEALMAGF